MNHNVFIYLLLQKLPRGILYEATAAKDSQNMKMNCYKDIIACKFNLLYHYLSGMLNIIP